MAVEDGRSSVTLVVLLQMGDRAVKVTPAHWLSPVFRVSIRQPAGVPPLTPDDASPFAAPGAFGPFRVMHQIGVGVLGPVFRTYEPSEDRLVAVKAFHLDITPEQARTLIEALERLIAIEPAHPGVVAPLAVGLENDVPYLAQEYVAAESLDVAIRHYSPASIETALPFIRQMAAAIDVAHAGGVVHGALHLRDIFVTPDEARVTGFGIVTALEEIGLAGPIRRPYTAPEVITGQEWGAAADRFALAAIAYELLTGRRAAGTGDQVTERIRSIDGVSDPEHLEEVFATALADDPEDRYSSGSRFVSALEFGAGEGPGDVVSVESEGEVHRDTAPLDLLAGLELRHQDSAADQMLDSVEQLESTARDDDDDDDNDDNDDNDDADATGGVDAHDVTDDDTDDSATLPADLVVEPHVSALDFDESEPDAQPSVDAALTEDEEARAEELRFQADEFPDDGAVPLDADGHGDNAAGDRADLEVIGYPTVSDDRYVVDDQDDQDDDDSDNNDDYPDAIQNPPPQTDEVYNRRSVWSRGIVPVLAIALVVGSVAYFLGVALAPNDGPTDQVLETPSASPNTADTADQEDPGALVNRELSDELVAAGAGAPARDAAGGAPARASNPAAEASSDTRTAAASVSDTDPVTRPAQEAPPVRSPSAVAEEMDQPGTRTVRLPTPRAAVSPALPEVSPRTGWLLVRTDPPGATVTLDGVGRGQTPLSLRDVSFGTHRLEVSHAGFGTVQREVTVNEQETIVPVGVRLTPARRPAVAAGDAAQMGSLSVQSRPPGAQVTVGGTLVGVTPLVVTLPVGRHQVLIQGDGYQAWMTSAEVTMSERAQVNASLERLTR